MGESSAVKSRTRDSFFRRPITFKLLSAALQQRVAQYDTASDTRQVSEKEVKSESSTNQGSVLSASHVIGRLGPAIAQLDLEHSFGLLVLSDDQLQVCLVAIMHARYSLRCSLKANQTLRLFAAMFASTRASGSTKSPCWRVEFHSSVGPRRNAPSLTR